MRYMRYPLPPGLGASAKVTETVIRAMVPRPDVSLVTTFYFGEVKNERTFLFPPILRREVLEAEPEEGDAILVYFTKAFDSFLDMLAASQGERFIVYGMGSRPDRGRIQFRAPSRDGFLNDLARSKAVIATAGFTLMTECLHLGKPLFALPMTGQFEQELNAHLLEDAGYGRSGRGNPEEQEAALHDFFEHVPHFSAALASYPRADNSAITAKLDELLADGGARAETYRQARRETSR